MALIDRPLGPRTAHALCDTLVERELLAAERREEFVSWASGSTAAEFDCGTVVFRRDGGPGGDAWHLRPGHRPADAEFARLQGR